MDVKPAYGTPLNPAHPYSQQLEGCWLMNEGAGLVLEDAVAGNDGTIAGSVSWGSDEYGPHLVFAATTDCPKIPHSAALNFDGLTGSYSFILGVKAAAQAANYQLLGKGGYPSAYPAAIYGGPGVLARGIIYDGGFAPQVSLGAVMDNVWRIVAFVVDNASDALYGYREGVLVQSVPNTVVSSTANVGPYYVGSNVKFDYDFIGEFGFIMAYSRALTAAQVAELFADPFCMFGAPPAEEVGVGPGPRRRRRGRDFVLDRGGFVTIVG